MYHAIGRWRPYTALAIGAGSCFLSPGDKAGLSFFSFFLFLFPFLAPFLIVVFFFFSFLFFSFFFVLLFLFSFFLLFLILFFSRCSSLFLYFSFYFFGSSPSTRTCMYVVYWYTTCIRCVMVHVISYVPACYTAVSCCLLRTSCPSGWVYTVPRTGTFTAAADAVAAGFGCCCCDCCCDCC